MSQAAQGLGLDSSENKQAAFEAMGFHVERLGTFTEDRNPIADTPVTQEVAAAGVQTSEVQTSQSPAPSQDTLIAESLLAQIQAVVKWPELADLINQWAQWKGWNDVERTSREITLLFKSEVAEAFEEHRKGKYEVYFSTDDRGFQKPEGFYTEIADLAIRVLHHCGLTQADQGAWWSYKPENYSIANWADSIEILWTLDSACWVSVDSMRDILVVCNAYLAKQGQSLMGLIKQKMEYNLTRAYRHGNKLV